MHGYHGEVEHILHRMFPVRGILHLLILKIIKKGPIHGSEIHKVLREQYNMNIPKPLIYTLLRRMEEKRLIFSRWETTESGPVKRIYMITDEGLDYLNDAINKLKKIKKIIDELCSED